MARMFQLSLSCLAICLAAGIPISSPHAQEPASVPIGEPFQVNTYTTDLQREPSIASGDEGDFVIVWTSRGSGGTDTNGYSVQGQRFSSDGTKIGAQFQVNTYTTSYQFRADVATDEAGDFVVVWQSAGSSTGDTSGASILGQRFASDGSPVASEFQVNDITTDNQRYPQIAMDPEGEFIVVWQDGPSNSEEIQGRRFQSDGNPLGSQFLVNSYTTGSQREPDVALAPDGSFQIVWRSDGSVGNDSSSSSIQGRRFASDGTPAGNQIQVNSVTSGVQTGASVDGDGSGEFIVVWQSQSTNGDDSTMPSVQGRRLAVDGSTQGPQFQVNQSTDQEENVPEVEVDDETGRFVVTWGAYQGALQEFRIGQFQSDGTRLGEEFMIPANTTFNPNSSTVFQRGGGFVVTWSDNVNSGGDSYLGVRGQRFGSAFIGDFVFLDQDFDGIQDPAEPGVAGVPVHLYSASGDLLESTETDLEGLYSFRQAVTEPTEYYLEFESPLRYSFTLTDAGNDDTVDSDADPLFGQTEDFEILDSGDVRDDLDAGLANGLGDRVWEDTNGNGIQDGSEPGFSGVTVELYDGGDSLISSTQTDSAGLYSFADLDPGTYYLQFVAPLDYAFVARHQGNDTSADSDADQALGTTSPLLFTNGTVRTDLDAGLEPAVIGNFVWLDDNADGRQQPYERGLAGVTVRLLDENDVTVTTTVTESGGLYALSGVLTGNFRIEVVAPPDSIFSIQDAGDNDLIDSDVDPLTGRSELFAYTAGAAARSYDAGLRLLPFFTSGFETGDVSEWPRSVP